MFFGLRGGFWLTSYPLFQALCLLLVSMMDSFAVDRRHHVRSVWAGVPSVG
jgi:hypothetical protein